MVSGRQVKNLSTIFQADLSPTVNSNSHAGIKVTEIFFNLLFTEQENVQLVRV